MKGLKKRPENLAMNGEAVKGGGSRGVGLVVFDWGGVILRHCRSWEEGCAAAGLRHFAEIERAELKVARRELHDLFQRGKVDPETFLDRLGGLSGGLYSGDELRLLHERWLLTEYAGIGPLIDLIHGAGVETGLLSNTNHLHWVRHLGKDEGGTEDFPTVRRLKHRHASHLMGLAKPDPAIYAEFERLTGFRGAEILFFDDLPDNCAAAAATGWRTVLVDHTRETAGQIRLALEAHGVL